MKSFIKFSTVWKSVAVLAGFLCIVSAAQAQQQLKIGVVNTERIFREAAPYKAAQAKIEQEFAQRQKDLQNEAARLKAAADKLDKDGPVLSDAQREKRQNDLADMDKEFQRDQREFREDLNQRRNEEMANLIDRTNRVIQQIAKSENYDLILQEAVYISPRIDITDKVLKALDQPQQ